MRGGATYRLQLTPSFGFARSAGVVPFLARLGVTHLYLSPILRARAGSEHGYDIVDPTRLNAELGGARGWRALVRAVRAHGLGIVVDIVPNHLAASPENPWWWDLLRRGPSSTGGRVFDVDASAATDGVLVPVLGEQLDDALAAGLIRFGTRRGAKVVRYHEHVFPLRPGTERLSDVAEAVRRQHYRLAFWRRANHEMNVRRFFDINELLAVRVEDPEVFERTHALLIRLARAGDIDAFRIDHIDGLRDPLGYLRRLRRAAGVPIVVEKILGEDERLPAAWPVLGTTGYEVGNAITAMQIDRDGLAAFDAAVVLPRFPTVLATAKREAIRTLLGAEVTRVVRALQDAGIDGDEALIREAVVEISVALDVYRTYGRASRLEADDATRIDRAARAARGHADARALATVARAFKREDPRTADAADRWQQLTGPAMAKGFEDTALYRWPRLLACNDVGSEPAPGWLDPARFHERSAVHGGLNAATTHDTKRSEDVRARLAALSELSDEALAAFRRWLRVTRSLRSEPRVPDSSDAWLLFQILVGAWPFAEEDDFADRIVAYMRKAAREAKRCTSWLKPDEAFEQAMDDVVRAALAHPEARAVVAGMVARVAWPGAVNSLANVVLRAMVPGIPDVYRGTERWDLSLVDPDSRRPVDLRAHERMLRRIDRAMERDPADVMRELLASWEDGRIKLLVLNRMLRIRAAQPHVFASGDYRGLRVTGPARRHVVACARRQGRMWVVAVVTRFPARVTTWGATRVVLPVDAPSTWLDGFTGEQRNTDGELRVGALLEPLPVAVLIGRR